jgi:hypothetical protein
MARLALRELTSPTGKGDAECEPFKNVIAFHHLN